MKTISVLGSTGSIGRQTAEVIARSGRYAVKALAAGSNATLLETQIRQFHPRAACLWNEAAAADLKVRVRDTGTLVLSGMEGLRQLIEEDVPDIYAISIGGMIALQPVLWAIRTGARIALSNKESIVTAGHLMMPAVKESGAELIPVDSEHSAVFQCLKGEDKAKVKQLWITASGGPFRGWSREQLAEVTPAQALKHPNWSMGAKITIDSATMMNKGFEVIEAHYLFDIPYEKIDVIIHKQSIIHSMVEYNDGSIMAQLGCPDMHLMIKYALLYPNHLYDQNTKYLDLDSLTSLDFRKMDYQRYPLVKLAKQVGQYEGNYGAVLNGANDEAVSLFLKKRIRFSDIEKYILRTLKAAHYIKDPDPQQIRDSHRWAREYVDELWANS